MNKFLRVNCFAAVMTSVFLQSAVAQPPSRVVERVEESQPYTLRGNTPPRARVAEDQGSVTSSFPLSDITIHLKRSDTQQQQLNQLLADQQNPKSPRYHKWLTPEQFGAQFGVSDQDAAKIKSWLSSKGFKNVQVSRSKTFIRMSGNASHVESAFHTVVHLYQGTDRLHFANATDPVLPHALEGVVGGISGLNDFHPRPHVHVLRRAGSAVPHFTSDITGNHYLAPGDFSTIYDLSPLYKQGIDGSGQKIAVAGQTDINLAQVATFRTNSGLSANAPTVVLGGTVDPGVNADDQLEAYLDVEWAGAVAPNAKIVYVNSTDVFTSAQYAIDNNVAPVLSLTYGLCEQQFGDTTATEAMFQQANAQGMSVVAASGDAGAADCDGDSASIPATATLGLSVDYPASSPEVTGVGGTEFNEGNSVSSYWSSTNGTDNSSALSYIPEMVWNDTAAASQLSAGGGGVSSCIMKDTSGNCAGGFAKPSWQTGNNVPDDGVRDVPDVSLNASVAHDQYLVCASDGTVTVNGKLQQEDCTNGFRGADTTVDVVGGTSAGSPSFAGVVALINQGFGAQGNVNPRLYSLASTSTDAFHDITTGNNIVPCAAPTTTAPNTGCPAAGGQMGYSAGPGYDLASGIGSIDGQHLVDEWAQGFYLSPANPSSVTVAASSSATTSAQVTFLGGFSASVGLSCTVSSALTTTTCSVPGSVTSTGSVTVTLSNSASSRLVPLRRNWNWWSSGALACGFAGLCLLAFAMRRDIRLRVALCSAAFLGLCVMSSCGGSSGGGSTPANPAVTGTVTLTASSGTTNHSTTISVTQE
jgi:subtilase family serine protease